MHILIVKGLHHKNEAALAKYNITYTRVQEIEQCNDLSIFDAVFCPNSAVDVSKYPNVKFVFGPHLSVLPQHFVNIIKSPTTIYIQPSQWAIDVWKSYAICSDLNMKVLPFGVDTERFCPDSSIKDKVFVYFKGRPMEQLQMIIYFLNSRGIEFKLFQYKQTYLEKDYLEYLKSAKYGIWLDAHESQEFALEEALSCNVPLLVWSVSTMNQEYGYSYPPFPATTVPYWDDCCGEVFWNANDFEKTFELFLKKLDSYHPRTYILDKLSIDVCEKQFIELLK